MSAQTGPQYSYFDGWANSSIVCNSQGFLYYEITCGSSTRARISCHYDTTSHPPYLYHYVGASVDCNASGKFCVDGVGCTS